MSADVFEYDGVGVAMRSDVLLIVYAAEARVHRSRWIFDRADEVAARCSRFYCLLIVETKQGLPDAATRAENAVRLRRLDRKVGVLVMVPLGDPLQVILLKAILRAMVLVLGEPSRHQVADDELDGIDRLRRAMGERAPSRDQLQDDLDALRAVLGGGSATEHASAY